jgi:hypothetical protein
MEWELAGETEVVGENLPQIPHDLTWAWTRDAAVGSRQLTASAMERPLYVFQDWDKVNLNKYDFDFAHVIIVQSLILIFLKKL